MPQLLVRNIEAAVVKKLRLKAARDGVSVEEEHRRVLRQVFLKNARPEKRRASSSRSAPARKSFKDPDLAFAKILNAIVRQRRNDLPREIEW